MAAPEDAPAPYTERRRPSLVLLFTMPQLALVATALLLLGAGLTFWMTTMARYQAVAIDRLDAIRQQSALMSETVAAHNRIVEADNLAFRFYARAVCEQLAIVSKQGIQQCSPDRLGPLRVQP